VFTVPPAPEEQEASEEAAGGNPNLRSTREVIGYRIHATDGQIGHVEDFIVSDEDWVIRYLVADTRKWLPGRSVLVSLEWVRNMSWETSVVDVPGRMIEDSPPCDPSLIEPGYEVQMCDFYGRPKYWT
jgi:hypothetical protein